MFYTVFFILVGLSFVAFLLLHQGYLAKTFTSSLNFSLHHYASTLDKEREKRELLDRKAVDLIEIWMDAQLKDKQQRWEREEEERKKEEAYEEEHVVTDEEIAEAKKARLKLERCYGLSHSLALQTAGSGTDAENAAIELQKLLGEILLKETPSPTVGFGPGGES